MSKKVKKIISKVLAVALAFSMAFPWSSLTALAEGEKAGTVTITDESQLVPFFPDANFRAIVFEAVKDGNDDAIGTDVEDALKNFTGNIKANQAGLTSVDQLQGIEYFVQDNTLKLADNNIEDWNGISKGIKNYGKPGDGDSSYNLNLDIKKNPFRYLPETFGGRFTVSQMGTAAYTYPEDIANKNIFFVRDSAKALSGTLDIARCKTESTKPEDTDGKTKDITLLSSSTAFLSNKGNADPDKLHVSTLTNTQLTYEGLWKSSIESLAIGTEEVIHYWTADESDTMTEGSQSFKYYMHPAFYVYDRITASSALGGNATLTKTDSVTKKPVAGAKYSVYKKADDSVVLSGLVTDADGKLTAEGLEQGDYYFKETEAPLGYKLNTNEIDFSITIQTAGTLPETKVEGGKTSITTAEGNTVTVGDKEGLIAGPDTPDNDSPDIKLASAEEQEIHLVRVTYSKLEKTDGTTEDSVIRTFDSLAKATTDINTEKNNNMILGPVSVNAFYTDPSLQKPVDVTTTDDPLPTTSISVEKKWVDKEDFTGTHPDITINLLQKIGSAAETVYKTQVLKDDELTVTFADLPAETIDGTKITYSVTEDKVTGYSDPKIEVADTGKVTITNTFENEKIAVEGTKTWVDKAGTTSHPPIWIHLLQNGVDMGEIVELVDGTTTYKFENLDKYDAKGKKYEYTVKEDPVKGYTTTYSGTDITNTFVNEKIAVEGTKTWVDKEGTKTHPKITIHLLKDGADTGKSVELEHGTTTYKFEGLDQYDSNGKAYVYTVKEDEVKGYTTTYAGTDITNTFVNEKIAVEGKKTWKDKEGTTTHPPILIHLLQNGVDTGKSVELIDGVTTYKFEDLDKYASDGTKYKYTVEEDKVEGYTATYSGTDITNTFENEEIAVEGTKTWIDKDGTTTHPEIIVELLRDGEKVDEKVLKDTETTYQFDKLPKYAADGKEYKYSVDEKEVPEGYTAKVDGYNITNTFVNEKISISGEKVWEDYDNRGNTRPENITIELYSNQQTEVVQTKTISSIGDGKYSFKELDKYAADGTKIVYSIKEQTVKNYSTTISSDNKTITNTYTGVGAIEFTKVGKYVEACSDASLDGQDPNATKPLEGAVFNVYNEDDQATSIMEATSNADGFVQFKDLPMGNYIIKETKAPAGYKLDETSYYAKVPYTYQGLTVKDGTPIPDHQVVNDMHRADISFKKVNEKHPDEVLPGSTYGLYKKVEGKKASRSADAMEGYELIAKAVTDKNGILTFKGVLLDIEYTIKELKAPDGSYVSKNPITILFNMDEKGEIKTTLEDGGGTAQMDPITGEITWLEPTVEVEFQKVDPKGKPVEGAKLEVRDKDNQVVAKWTSTNKPHTVSGVFVIGETYTLVETKAPAGYKIATPIVFTISKEEVGPGEQKVQVIKMIDELIPKVPEEPGKPNKPGEPNKPNEPGKPTVDTSDTSQTTMWTFLIFAAGAVILVLGKKRSRYR